MSPIGFQRLSDERLSTRLAAGEAAAFDELYRRYVHRLSAYGAHLLGDAAAGEDVAQAAMLKAYQALRSGKLPERVRPWLYRIAHNIMVDFHKRRRRSRTESIDADPARDLPAAGDLGDSVALRDQLSRALRHLTGEQARVLLLGPVLQDFVDGRRAGCGSFAGFARHRLIVPLRRRRRFGPVALGRRFAGRGAPPWVVSPRATGSNRARHV